MKLKIKQIRISLFILILTLCYSCKDDMGKLEWGYSKVYMPQASMLDGGLTNNYPVPLNDNPSTRNFILTEDSNLLQIVLGVYRSGKEDLKEYSVDISANYNETQSFMKDVDDAVMLPEETYTLPVEANVNNGERESTFHLTVDLNKIIQQYPEFATKNICLTVEISNPSHYELNESLAKTNIIIDGSIFLPKPPSLTVTPKVLNMIASDGKDITFTIDSDDSEWEYSILGNPIWITEKKKTATSLTLSISENKDPLDREANVLFNLRSSSTVKQEVLIAQRGKAIINLIKGGDMSEGSLSYWEVYNFDKKEPYFPNSVSLDNGVMILSYGSQNVNEYTGIIQEVDLIENKKYRFSADFTATGGASESEIAISFEKTKPEDGEYYWFLGADVFSYVDTWGDSDALLQGYDGSFMDASSAKKGFDSDGVFIAPFSGKGYFIIAFASWDGTVGTVSFDNIVLEPVN